MVGSLLLFISRQPFGFQYKHRQRTDQHDRGDSKKSNAPAFRRCATAGKVKNETHGQRAKETTAVTKGRMHGQGRAALAGTGATSSTGGER